MKPKSKNTNNAYLWNWKRSSANNKTNSESELPAIKFLREKTQQVKDKTAGPGLGAGIGCGAGLGVGLAGGLGFGAGGWPENQMRFVFGLGVGCGIGLGFGYGQGIGYGISLEDFEDHFFSEKNSDSGRKILIDY